jgi:hypothetical protein
MMVGGRRAIDLARGGRFRVVLHYRDGTPSPPPAPPGAVSLAAELVSAPLTLELPWPGR